MKEIIKIGDIVRNKVTGKYGIIVSKYENGGFDFEVFALNNPFPYGGVWQDCFKEDDLIKTTYQHYAKSLIDEDVLKEIISEMSFMKRIKLLFTRKLK